MEIEHINEHKPRQTGEALLHHGTTAPGRNHARRAAGPKPRVVLSTSPPKHAKTMYALVGIDRNGGVFVLDAEEAECLPVGKTILQAGLSENVSVVVAKNQGYGSTTEQLCPLERS